MFPSFGLFGFGGLVFVVEIVMCVHVVRTNRELYWILVILMLQPIGAMVYLFAIFIPDMLGGSTGRRISRTARDTLDPEREYRQAKSACDDTPTVHNQMRLAAAAAGLGRHDEAERLYGEAAQGIHADDPALLLGRAKALVELGRFAEAMPLLGAVTETPPAVLARARALEGLGEVESAERAYQSAVERVPGLEAIARYAVFLARTGRQAQAHELLADIDKRVAKANSHFRGEARMWRDFAAKGVG